MGNEINQNAILQAILELSDQVKSVEERLTQRFDRLETNLSAKIKKLDEKVGVLSLELLETKADVSLLKKAK